MNELVLVKSADFEGIQCDFYCDGKDFYISGQQIGLALKYPDSGKAIENIHNKNKDRLEKYSFLESRNGKNTYFYNRDGVVELLSLIDNPSVETFDDFCWYIMGWLQKSGKYREYNVWRRAVCIQSVYDPWEYPKLAFIEGRAYRAYHYEDGHWEVHSGANETGHAVELLEEEFNNCFRAER